jgi:hypothetical protein
MDRRNFCKWLIIGAGSLATPVAPAIAQGDNSAVPIMASSLTSMKFGFFVHYVWAGNRSLTVDRRGHTLKSLDDLANAFDVKDFADDLAAWQVEYVIFTAWHAGINPLFPSETMKKWGLDSHYCRRDLLGEIITALDTKGIKVMFYTHPRDGHDLSPADQRKTGWNGSAGGNPDWAKFDFQKWNDFNNDLYAELVKRYGKRILGLYLDEGSALGDSWRVVDYPRLRRTIKGQNPNLIMVQNYYGTLYSCDVGDMEYHHWREFESRDGGFWPANRMAVGTCFASTWFAVKPAGTNTVVFSAEDMFRYTVLQAGVNTEGGGVQWAAGPYAGGGWETGVDETMQRLAAYIKPIAASIKGVYASRAFPTRDGMTFHSTAWGAPKLTWGVATDTPDGSATYLHILKAPSGRALRVGMPANNQRFSQATLLPDGASVELRFDNAGYVVVLPEGKTWSPLDTVIALHR